MKRFNLMGHCIYRLVYFNNIYDVPINLHRWNLYLKWCRLFSWKATGDGVFRRHSISGLKNQNRKSFWAMRPEVPTCRHGNWVGWRARKNTIVTVRDDTELIRDARSQTSDHVTRCRSERRCCLPIGWPCQTTKMHYRISRGLFTGDRHQDSSHVINGNYYLLINLAHNTYCITMLYIVKYR